MIVYKYGGHAIPDPAIIDPAIVFLANLIKSGEQIVIVHGGGPQINRELEIHGIKSEIVKGLRKTTPEVFEIVQRTLSGEVLRNLVNQLVSQGINAMGISAADGSLIRCDIQDNELGLVGEVAEINSSILITLLREGITPVISPIGVTKEGTGVNMNADLVAGAIAGSLKADVVMFSTDVAGIYRNWPDEATLIDLINVSELSEISREFEGGMIPKARAAISAIQSGAKSVRIFDGRNASNLSAVHAGKIGTLVVP